MYCSIYRINTCVRGCECASDCAYKMCYEKKCSLDVLRVPICDTDWIRLSVRAYVFVRMDVGVRACVCMFTSIQCCFEGHLEKIEWQTHTHTRARIVRINIEYVATFTRNNKIYKRLHFVHIW